MLKDFTKVIFTAKAALDVIKEKLETKASDWAVQVKAFTEKNGNSPNSDFGYDIKEKAKEELIQLVSEISHRAQTEQLQLTGFLKEKLTEFTNSALLDSMELKDIRTEITSLKAEIVDLKSQLETKKKK